MSRTNTTTRSLVTRGNAASRANTGSRSAANGTPFTGVDVTVTVDRNTVWKTSTLKIGATYIQENLQADTTPLTTNDDSTPIAQAKALLTAFNGYANQHVCNFGGSSNLVPTAGDITTPNTWSWTTLDRRLQMMYITNSTPMITLGLVPSWMRPGGSTATDDPWDDAREDDMVTMFTEVAKRYKPNSSWWTGQGISNYGVTEYQFWNELKGLFSSGTTSYTPDPNDPRGSPQNKSWTNKMDMTKYVRAYNKTVVAFNTVYGSANAYKIGGPYLVVEGSGGLSTLGIPPNPAVFYNRDPWSPRNQEYVEYFFAFAKKIDYLVYDYRLMDGEDGPADGVDRWLLYPPHQRIKLSKWFGDVAIASRSFARTNYQGITVPTDLEIRHAEDYVIKYESESLEDPTWRNWAVAATASMFYHDIRADVGLSLRWGPEQGAGKPIRMDWFNKTTDGTVTKTVIYDIYKLFRDNFYAGTTLYTTTCDDNRVEVLANATKTLIINTAQSARIVSINGTRVRVEGFTATLFTI